VTTRTETRRRVLRYPISASAEATVEIPCPGSEQRQTFALVDVSGAGVSFALDGDTGGIELGGTLPAASIRIGECRLAGDLLVMHLTPDASGRLVCGALFYPAEDSDLVKLKSLISGMEALARV
jgi:hypothetical protein